MSILRRRASVAQESPNVLMDISSNPEVLAVCYAQGMCRRPNYMTYEEAAAVTDIGTVFRNNTDIKHFDELEYFNVTSLEQFAFAGCTNLESIKLPSNLETMGGYVIVNTKIESLTFPATFKTSGGYAIQNNTQLKDVEFFGVTSFGANTFNGSTLESITIHVTTPPTLASSTFNNVSGDFNIYVPTESVNTYKAANRWSNYANNIFAIPT